MLQHLKDISNQSNTTNGDHAYDSTLNSVLDLFGKGGAMRHDENEFVRLLDKAYSDTPDLALKTLFYLRVIDSCKEAFESAGYPFPEIIFWNVAGHSTVPVTKNEQGVALVSGASPSTLKAILASKDLSPERLMLDVLLSERYDNISA